jgi:hypothetical protein
MREEEWKEREDKLSWLITYNNKLYLYPIMRTKWALNVLIFGFIKGIFIFEQFCFLEKNA